MKTEREPTTYPMTEQAESELLDEVLYRLDFLERQRDRPFTADELDARLDGVVDAEAAKLRIALTDEDRRVVAALAYEQHTASEGA